MSNASRARLTVQLHQQLGNSIPRQGEQAALFPSEPWRRGQAAAEAPVKGAGNPGYGLWHNPHPWSAAEHLPSPKAPCQVCKAAPPKIYPSSPALRNAHSTEEPAGLSSPPEITSAAHPSPNFRQEAASGSPSDRGSPQEGDRQRAAMSPVSPPAEPLSAAHSGAFQPRFLGAGRRPVLLAPPFSTSFRTDPSAFITRRSARQEDCKRSAIAPSSYQRSLDLRWESPWKGDLAAAFPARHLPVKCTLNRCRQS